MFEVLLWIASPSARKDDDDVDCRTSLAIPIKTTMTMTFDD